MKPQKPNEALTPGGVAVPPPLLIESPLFQGSLATLFHLAREGRVDLTGIPLAPVCEAYLQFIYEGGPTANVDEAGAALLALAYLVERKAWGLLPIADPPPPEDIPELPEPTVHEFAMAVDTLDSHFRERAMMFFRAAGTEGGDYDVPIEIGHLTTAHLAKALERLLAKALPTSMEQLGKPRPSLAEVMRGVLLIIRAADGRVGFADLLPDQFTRLDAVFVFLAVLELLRVGQIASGIDKDDIWLAKREK